MDTNMHTFPATHSTPGVPPDRQGFLHPAAMATQGMQGYQHFNTPPVRTVPSGIGPLQGTYHTPTLPHKVPLVPVSSHSLTPQLVPKHQSVPPTNQMSALSFSHQAPSIPHNSTFPAQPIYPTQSPPLNQFPPGTSAPLPIFPPLRPPLSSGQQLQPLGMHTATAYQQTHFNQPSVPNPMLSQPPPTLPTNQPIGLTQFPSAQPMGHNFPPTNQPVPSTDQPMGLNQFSSGQFMGHNQFTTGQPMGHNIPPTNQPMGLNMPPTNQPMGHNMPPTNQPMGHNVPPTNQPMGHNMPPTNQPMGLNMPPTNQPMGLNMPPTNQPMGHNVPPTNQPMGHNMPPTNQPMGHNMPPTNQLMGHNMPPTNQPMGLNMPPTNQPMGLNQFPPQLAAPGQQAPMGQFGAPVTSQPRVTPDSIPSVIEVLGIERERWVSNEYLTGSRTPPPGALVSCPIRDTGNASPRFVRSSLYTLPLSAEMVRESKLVAGLIIQPLADDPDNKQLPLVDHGPGGPIRCKRCKAYMNPFNSFSGGGASFNCIFCDVSNEVPPAYFQHCDAGGKRMDAADRSELSLGSYELCVTRDYMRFQREGDPPAVVFVVDISMRSYNTGLEGFLSSHIGELLERLPREGDTGQCPMEVGLVLYDTQAYYFNLSAPLPLVYVITEPHDPFLPEPAGSLVPVPQAIISIKGILERFPSLFPQRKSGGSLGVGVRAGLSLLSEMRRVGKLIVFQADIPETPGPGQIKRRTDNFFKPQTQFYDKLSADCQRAGVSVDLFLLPTAYTDVFTLGQLCHFSGGQLHYHYNFSASKPSSYSRLLTDLQETLGTEMGFDAVMRVRTSSGLSPDQYQGAMRLSGTEIQLPGCDANKSVAVVLRYEDKLKENSLAYIQVALLYTNFRGERRLRLHNLALCTSSHFEDVYLSADLDAMVQLLARLNLRGFIEEQKESVSDRIRLQVAHILATYRRHCNPGLNKGQLILPATMKLLPCYSNCILKLPVAPLHTSLPNSPDTRAYSFYRLQWLSTRDFLLQLYPMVYPLDPELSSLPDPIRASHLRLEEQRAYLATDGQQVVMWVGNGLHMNTVAQVFGVSSVHQVDPSLSTLPKLDNNTSRHLHQTIDHLHSWTGRHLALSLSKQGDQSEQLFRGLLVEDGGTGSPSYVDGTCMLHREIKKLLS